MKNFICVIHGGAGAMKPPAAGDKEGQAWYNECHQGLRRALAAAYGILDGEGAAVDAVVAAVEILEDDPHFNAGRGGVFAADGTVELDASLMDGRTGAAGGVTGLKTVKNPIRAAQAVLLHSPHTLLAGAGAEDFARRHGLETVPNEYFHTERALHKLKKVQQTGRRDDGQSGYGTVGAVALDAHGNLAAATSTGGLSNKTPGRVSDSAIIGAGTFAKNGVCAVSCTGTGDVFIRCATAFDVAAMIEYKEETVEESARAALAKIKKAGGSGGIIAVGGNGDFVMHFNDPGMYRGFIRPDNNPQTFIFGPG